MCNGSGRPGNLRGVCDLETAEKRQVPITGFELTRKL